MNPKPFKRPTITSLLIAAGIALIATGGAFAAVKATSAKRQALAETDSVVGASGKTLGLSRVVVPPGTKLALHRHEGTQIARIVKGTLTYTVVSGSASLYDGEPGNDAALRNEIDAGETVKVKAGQWLIEPPTDIHRAANKGRTPIVILLSTLFSNGAPPSIPVDPGTLEDIAPTRAPLASAAYKSPKRVGRYLTNKFFHLLVAKNRRGLRKFLAKGFQIERADGTGITGAKNYIADLPNVKRFRLSGFRASRSGRVLMVRYYSQATESLNQAPITTSKAPRLSTFIWSGKRWRMTSHSNFAVLPK